MLFFGCLGHIHQDLCFPHNFVCFGGVVSSWFLGGGGGWVGVGLGGGGGGIRY